MNISDNLLNSITNIVKGGNEMNLNRAEEIASSPVMAYVTYQGERVYIQNVDKERETARVYPLDDPSREMDVHLNDLIEH